MQKRSLKANCSPSSRYVVCSATFLDSPIDAINFRALLELEYLYPGRYPSSSRVDKQVDWKFSIVYT